MTGWVHVPTSHELLQREREYATSVVSWLNSNFPELRRQEGMPHPAAVAAVTRLHKRYGKGSLTRERHGDLILGAVTRFRKEYE